MIPYISSVILPSAWFSGAWPTGKGPMLNHADEYAEDGE